MDHYITKGVVRVLTTPGFRNYNPENGKLMFYSPFLYCAPNLTLCIWKPLLSSKFKSFCLLLCYQSHKVSKNTPFLLNDSQIFYLTQQTSRQLTEQAPWIKLDIVYSGLHFFIFKMRDLDYVSIRIRFSCNRDQNNSSLNQTWGYLSPT